jgi:AraC-like DNA-binding protein
MEVRMDALSEVLSTVRMTGAIFISAEFTAPWGFATPHADQAVHILAPGTERIVSYHLVVEGRAFVKIPGEPDLVVEAGEIVVIPHGQAHTFSNGSPANFADGAETLKQHVAGDLHNLRGGAGGAVTKFICGFFGCERHAERLFLAGLPAALKINIRDDVTGAWLESSIRYLVSESQHGLPGRSVLLSKMAEAIFIQTLCRYAATLPHDKPGWLAAARDPTVGAALAALHRRPAHAWTTELLASEIGTSRSVLAERFTRYLDEPPLAYLARWRLQLAARKLQTTRDTVLQVALDVGYESESAFNRAFKREFGAPPARYRKSVAHETSTLV